MGAFIELAKLFGPTAAAMAFFVWRDYKREAAMSQRLRETEEFVRERMMTIIASTTASMDASTAAAAAAAAAIRQVIEALSRRPCLKEERLEKVQA